MYAANALRWKKEHFLSFLREKIAVFMLLLFLHDIDVSINRWTATAVALFVAFSLSRSLLLVL